MTKRTNKEKIVADFETTTNELDCRVWVWGWYNVLKDSFEWGKDITSFMEKCANIYSNDAVYFHNLKFDGDFILNWLFENGFQWVAEKKLLESKTFTTTISDKGQFYIIQVCFYKDLHYNNQVTFYDSLKIIPLPVKAISKNYGIEQLKGEIDYHKKREIGYEPTEIEIDYLQNDCEIVGKALKQFWDDGLTAITIGSNAIKNYKSIFGKKNFNKTFPILDKYTDTYIRESYRGGFTWCNPKFQNKIIGKGQVFDVNSLYPSRMHSSSGCSYPYGEPIYFKGKYKKDKLYDLYICRIYVNFKLKKDMIPTIQIKRNLLFCATEYLNDSNNKEVELYLTSVDLELFLKHYDIIDITYLDGYKFKSATGLFDSYIDFWIDKKITAEKNGLQGLRSIAKLLLNNLYGKFGTNPNVRSKIPVYEDGKVKFEYGEQDEREPVFIAVAVFVTAYARKYTIESVQKIGLKKFVYADTDSLHIVGDDDFSNIIEIDSYKLGAWKKESVFEKAKFLRQKCYIETENGINNVTVAGMPSSCHSLVTYDNFKLGQRFKGRTRMKRVQGGIVLVDCDFTLKG